MNGTTAENQFHVNGGLSNGNCKQQELKEASQMDILRRGCSDQPNINEIDFHWSDTTKDSRPASPTTQALMCDEQETTFGNDYRCSFPSVSCDQDISEINAAQENLVLTGLREYLRVIITRGKINGETVLLLLVWPSVNVSFSFLRTDKMEVVFHGGFNLVII